MLISTILLTADPFLGKMDAALLTQQQRMELFVTSLDDSPIADELGGDCSDACTWAGVSCNDEIVQSILWSRMNVFISASIDFTMFPLHLSIFDVFSQNLIGEVNLQKLPQTMTMLSLMSCKFSGTLDCSALPPQLEYLCVSGNAIQAIKNIVNLPEVLEFLDFAELENQKKSVKIGALPENGLIIELNGCGIQDIELEVLEVSHCG